MKVNLTVSIRSSASRRRNVEKETSEDANLVSWIA